MSAVIPAPHLAEFPPFWAVLPPWQVPCTCNMWTASNPVRVHFPACWRHGRRPGVAGCLAAWPQTDRGALPRLLTALAAIGGGAVAIRHIWLQNLLADEVPACGPGLEYMMDVFPMQNVIQQVLAGSGECAEMDWSFLGLSLPAWSLVVFSGLLVLALIQIFRPLPR